MSMDPSGEPPLARRVLDDQPADPSRREIRLLMFYFGLAYFMQGISQHTALLNQPLKFYFKEAMGFDAGQTTKYLSIVMIPWVIKPIYGLISDYVPLFGYRRKSYLLLLNALVIGAFLWLAGITQPQQVVLAVLLGAFGVAAGDVLVDAIMVEKGQATGRVKQFQGVQWFCIYAAATIAALLGGWLCQTFAPARALGLAGLIAAIPPIGLFVATWLIVREPRRGMDLHQLRTTTRALLSALGSLRLWLAAGFLGFFWASQAIYTVLYYYQTDTLKFQQDFIGRLDAIYAVGAMAGAALYTAVLAKWFSTRTLLAVSIILGAGSTVAWLAVSGSVGAIAVSVITGVAYIITNLATLSLAAEACPKNAEGFTFAALMAIINLGRQLGEIASGHLYATTFANQYAPVALTFAGVGLLAFVLLPLLSSARARP